MFATLIVSTIATIVVVVIHYEFLNMAARSARLVGMANQRRSLIVVMLAAVLAHVVEVWVFAFAFHGLLMIDGVGEIIGIKGDAGLWDYAYFSFVCYTTLGFGELVPEGFVRFLAGTEALIGLMLITWTASFLYMQMEQTWKD